MRKRNALSSLRVLGREVPREVLTQVQPIFLLQVLIGLSQTLNGSASQLEGLARALILDGQQRLRRLRDVAPHLHLPFEDFLEVVRSKDHNRQALSDEEGAVQAMLEMCLGLMLRWLSKTTSRVYPVASPIAWKLVLPFDTLFPSGSLALLLPLRVRACPIL